MSPARAAVATPTWEAVGHELINHYAAVVTGGRPDTGTGGRVIAGLDDVASLELRAAAATGIRYT